MYRKFDSQSFLHLFFKQYIFTISMSFFHGFPFGGMGGRFGQEEDDEDSSSQEVDNNKYYELLGVSKSATQTEIKKAYLNLAKVHHPDKGGDADKFNQLKQAYQTLSDPQKKQIYDKYGSKGLKEGGGMGGHEDLLNMFFNNRMGGMGQTRKQVQKVKATKKALQVTLQNMYNGEILKIPHKRTRCCQTCKGKGGSEVKTCTECKGKGVIVKLLQMGPGMYQQIQQHCSVCKGQGKSIEQKNKCKTCKGEKVIEKEKILEVSVEKGTPAQHAITLSGEGDQLPDCLAGDIIFIVVEKKHAVFTRVGADLFMKKKISLADALVGFQFTLKHLDGTSHTISIIKNDIIGDKDKKIVRNLGMPFFKDGQNYGNLVIEFEIVMPKAGELKPQQIEALSKILPGKVNPKPKDSKYELLENFDAEDVNTNEEGGRKKDEQQEEQSRGGQRVQCASQ